MDILYMDILYSDKLYTDKLCTDMDILDIDLPVLRRDTDMDLLYTNMDMDLLNMDIYLHICILSVFASFSHTFFVYFLCKGPFSHRTEICENILFFACMRNKFRIFFASFCIEAKKRRTLRLPIWPQFSRRRR